MSGEIVSGPVIGPGLQIHEMSLTIHPRDHEPDWSYGVCRMCGLGQIQEVVKDEQRTTDSTPIGDVPSD